MLNIVSGFIINHSQYLPNDLGFNDTLMDDLHNRWDV